MHTKAAERYLDICTAGATYGYTTGKRQLAEAAMQERGHIAAGQPLQAKRARRTLGAPTGVSRPARAKLYPPAEPGWQLAFSESLYADRT